MRDRTEEFNRNCLAKSSQARSQSAIQIDSSNISESDATSLFVIDFLKKVEEIYKMFSNIDQKIREVTDIQSTVLEFSESDDRLYVFYDQIKKGFYRISEKITELENSFDVTKFYGSDTELRICTSQVLTLKRKLTCTVADYYNIQEEYKEKCRARVERQAQISGADLSKIDFDGAIQSGTDVFLQTVFPDYNVARHYLQEIEQRHEEFLRLENSLRELRDLIFDLNLILKVDYALINRIDKHARVVNLLVYEGNASAKQYREGIKTHNYKYYVTFCCCATMTAIILLALLSTFR